VLFQATGHEVKQWQQEHADLPPGGFSFQCGHLPPFPGINAITYHYLQETLTMRPRKQLTEEELKTAKAKMEKLNQKLIKDGFKTGTLPKNWARVWIPLSKEDE